MNGTTRNRNVTNAIRRSQRTCLPVFSVGPSLTNCRKASVTEKDRMMVYARVNAFTADTDASDMEVSSWVTNVQRIRRIARLRLISEVTRIRRRDTQAYPPVGNIGRSEGRPGGGGLRGGGAGG